MLPCRYNLLREESEGYAKLITALCSFQPGDSGEALVIARLLSLTEGVRL